MNLLPKPLKKGDTIAIVAPAKHIEASFVHFAQTFLEERGFLVRVSEYCLGRHHYFSGTIAERLSDMQQAIDDPQVDAILCARGGYGCVQLVDQLNWSSFLKNPKWMIGFSDVTVFHSRLQASGVASIHGTMPLNFQENSAAALQTLLDALRGSPYTIFAPPSPFNQLGSATGSINGGNLAIIASLIGTNDQPDFSNSILFVEEIGEPLYSIDRMFFSLKKAGILNQINGLIVGGMTSLKDSEVPYGSTLKEIIHAHIVDLNIPVCFHFPAGHIDDNQAVILGAKAHLQITENESKLSFLLD